MADISSARGAVPKLMTMLYRALPEVLHSPQGNATDKKKADHNDTIRAMRAALERDPASLLQLPIIAALCDRVKP